MTEGTFNPFPGLRSFQADEDYLFFGREEQIDQLHEKLRRTHLVAVVGPSGCGKSSLVLAGLLPTLHGDFTSDWKTAILRPGVLPITNLALALAGKEALGEDQPDEDEPFLIESILRRGGQGLIEVYSRACARGVISDGGRLLILVDQFEELFRYKDMAGQRSINEAEAFVKLLLSAADSKIDNAIYIILTMRSDFLGECSRFMDLPEAINDGHFLVRRMTRDERRRAIEGPVAVGGGHIAADLTNSLLNEAGDNPDQLPILQHVLMRVWDCASQDGGESIALELHHYDKCGGLKSALDMHLEQIFSGLSSTEQKVTERVFSRLTELRPDERGVRRPTSFAELCSINSDPYLGATSATPELVRSVLDHFRGSGRTFLMPPEHIELLPNTVVDISHESLMRSWTRLIELTRQERDNAARLTRLVKDAEEFILCKRYLIRDPELSLVEAWALRVQPTLPWAMRYLGENGAKAFANGLEYLNTSRIHEDYDVDRIYEARKRTEVERDAALGQATEAGQREQIAFRFLRTQHRDSIVFATVVCAFFVCQLVAPRESPVYSPVSVSVMLLFGFTMGYRSKRSQQEHFPVFEVQSEPNGADVLIDGTLKVRTPARLKTLYAGSHEVLVTYNGFQPARVSVVLKAGVVNPITVVLQPEIPTEEVLNVVDSSLMIRIPAGPFTMGSNDGFDNEKPAHIVTLPDFYMGKFQVTNAQFRRFVTATNYVPSGDWERYARIWGDEVPVVEVSWMDARAYCAWAGGRLPTEAEWEKAARGTDAKKYPWTGDWDAARCCCSRATAYDSKSPVAVGSYLAGRSHYGCHDMAGNVWEWCSSKLAPYPYRTDDGREEVDGDELRVRRGGSWECVDVLAFRACNRTDLSYGSHFFNRGFRLARTGP